MLIDVGLPLDPALAIAPLLPLLMAWVYAFVLVAARLSGLFVLAPVLGQPVVPVTVRVLVVIGLSFLLTPTLARQAHVGFVELDVDQSGFVERDELPANLRGTFADRFGPDERLSRVEFLTPVAPPTALIELGMQIASELLIGLLLGFGVSLLMTALQLLGEFIDQQTGVGLGEVFNPGLGITAGMSAKFLFMLGSVVLLCLEPIGGHLLMVDAVARTFRVVPVGLAPFSGPLVPLTTDLLTLSFGLVIQLVAPFIAAMALVSLTLGFLGYTVPQINVMTLGFGVRAVVNLFVLALTLSGTAAVIAEQMPQWIDGLLPLWLGGGGG